MIFSNLRVHFSIIVLIVIHFNLLLYFFYKKMFNLNHIKKSSEYIAFTSLLWGSPSDTRKFIMPQVNYLIKLGSVSILFVQFYYLKFLNYLQGTVS